ncbi:MAG: hypothetical protein GX610_20840 [Rhodococcus sp.]|nr:hypothetical protein [Rhodococcus sp. (in: high G+C Gram-positive bacteria)]
MQNKENIELAAIDEKIAALNFHVTTQRTPDQVAQLIADAAEVSGSAGPKTTLTRVAAHQFNGVMKNFARVQMAEFTVTLQPASDGRTAVQLSIGDYLRTRDTLFYFIPITPWGAPGYKALASFSDYLRNKL